ncbi:MAG: hypothetical protein E6I20_08910, partial [Chloroflexi bacterium]
MGSPAPHHRGPRAQRLRRPDGGRRHGRELEHLAAASRGRARGVDAGGPRRHGLGSRRALRRGGVAPRHRHRGKRAQCAERGARRGSRRARDP